MRPEANNKNFTDPSLYKITHPDSSSSEMKALREIQA